MGHRKEYIKRLDCVPREEVEPFSKKASPKRKNRIENGDWLIIKINTYFALGICLGIFIVLIIRVALK